MQERNRVMIWDNYKFCLILTVVLGHIVQYYLNSSTAKSMMLFILLFHMPAFMFITGLFSKNLVNNKRYDKAFAFFGIYIITKVLIYVSQLICGMKPKFSLLTEAGVPWFAFSLMIFYFVTMILSRFRKSYVLLVSLLLACFVGYDSSVGDYLVLARTITFYPYFYLGYCLQQDDVIKFAKRKSIQLLSGIVLIVTVVACLLYLNDIWWLSSVLYMPYSGLQQPALGAALRLIRYVIGLVITFAFVSVIPNIQLPIMKWGSRTIQVFVLHRPFIYLWFGFEVFPNQSKWISVFVFGTILTIVLSTKWLEKPFRWLLNPRLN